LHTRWRGVVRDTDVICSWGHYEPSRFLAAAGLRPKARLDLRHVATDVVRARVGALSDYRENVGPSDGPFRVEGRGGRKLRALADIIDSFTRIAASSPGHVVP